MFRGLAVRYRPYLLVLLLLAFAVPAFSQGARRSKGGDDAGEPDQPGARELYFRRGRTVPGQSAAALRYRAYKEKMARRAAARSLLASPRSPSAGSPAAPDSPSPAGPAWVPMGPAPIGLDPSSGADFGVNSGRVTSVAVDQNDATGNTVYAGAAYGGLWKSSNAADPDPAAVEWTPLIDDQATLSVGAIALKPDDSNTILVGTGEANGSGDSYYGLGILRSTDGGATWSLITSTSDNIRSFKGLAFSKIAFSTDDPNLVVAATANSNATSFGIDTSNIRGIYYSTDAGATWQYATVQDNGITITPASTSSVIYHPTLHKFLAAIRYHGYYSSIDGAHWTRLPVQPTAVLSATACPAAVSFNCPIYRGEIAIQPVTGAIFTWFVDANNGNRGIYRSVNGGTNWNSVGITGITSCGDSMGCGTLDQGYYDLDLAAVPNGTGTDLYAGAINIYKCSLSSTAVSCSTWLNLTHVYGCTVWGAPAHVHPDQHGVDFSHARPGLIYFGHDGGVSRALNAPGLLGGACTSHNAFDNLSGTLGSLTEFVSFSEHPTDQGTVLGGAQDVGSAAVDSSHPGLGNLAWMNVNSGDGGFNAINPSNPMEWFTANTDVSIQRCLNGINCNYQTFLPVITPIKVGGDHGDFYTPYILDPGMPSRIIVGTCRVWRGNSDGTGWTSANALTTNFATSTAATCTGNEGPLVSALAAGGPVDANGSQVIYAATANGALLSTTNASGGPSTWSQTGYAGRTISDVAVDPNDPTGRTAYFTVMGFYGPHVYKTTTAGPWTSISGDLPDVPADSVAVDPNDSSVIYVGTDVGVFVTTDGGVDWTEWGTGLPNAPVTRVRTFVSPDGATNKLRVSTYGRGVWQTDLLTATPIRASVQSAAATVFAGQTASYQLTVTAGGNFQGTVTISCEGGPDTCVGGTISPVKGGTPFTVTASNVTAGNFNFSLKLVASDANNTTVEIPVSLEVDDLQMSALNPGGLVLKRGQSSQLSLTLTAFGPRMASLSAVVNCTGLPAGATCTSSPSPVYFGGNPAPTVTLTVHTDFNATPPGSYAPTVVASLPPLDGQPAYTASQPLALEVDPNVDFTLASNPPSAALTVGQNPPTFNITLDSHDGYTGNVTLGCSIDQPGPSCSVAPGPYSTFPSVVPLVVDLNGLTGGSFNVTLSGNDGNHTNDLVVPVSLADFSLASSNGSLTATGFSGGGGAFSFSLQSLNGYNRQVQVTCDSTAISPQSVCTPDLKSFYLNPNFTISDTIRFTVPAAVLSGTFPVHIVVSDVLTGAPQHTLDVLVTVQGFLLTRTGPMIQSGPLGQFSQSYNLSYTPTGGMSQTVYFYCQSAINVNCIFSPSYASSAPTNVTVQVSVWSQADASQFPDGKVSFTPSANLLNTYRIPGDGPLTYQVYDLQVVPAPGIYPQLVPGGAAQQVQFSLNELGSSSPVSLSCTPPANITCTVTPGVLNGTGTATLSLAAATSAPANGNWLAAAVNATGSPGGTTVTRTASVSFTVGNFTQNASPLSASIPPNGSADFNVTYTGTGWGGYPATIAVACANVPAGATCTANPSSVYFGQTSDVHLSTTAGVTPANFTLTITGTANGATKTTSVPVRVVDFSLTSTTSAAAVNAGTSVAASLRATAQNGFNSSVALSCPAVAPGISCTFTPSALIPLATGSTITARILTTAATPPGVYTVPLTATANSVSHTVNFTLTVKNFHASVQPDTAITPVGGGRATYALTFFADQGFNNLLALSCVTPPLGVTCAFSPTSVTPTQAGAPVTLTVTVASTVPQASRTLNIRALFSTLSQTIPVTLLTGADFSLATVTGQQTVQQTQAADFHLTATALGGMNQPVTLSCSGLPAGATCQFDQNPVTPSAAGQDVDVTIQTTLSSVPNAYTLTVQGVGGGVTHSTTLSLNLQPFPDFVLNTAAPVVATRPGQNAVFSATVSKNGSFSSIVDLTCAGALPPGATCQILPASIDFSSTSAAPVTVTIATPLNSPLADTTFALHGVERGGLKTHDLALTLRVNDFHLSAPTPLTFAQTDTASYTVTVFADHQFSSAVTLACNNLPANVGPCSFSSNNFVPAAGGTAVTVSLPVGGLATPGPASFDVVASGGNTAHSVTEPLNIILVQDFTIATMAPLSQTAIPGQTVGWGILLTPLNSFAASVNLTVSGCPAGFTCSFQPAPPFALAGQVQQPVNFIVQVPANAAAVNSNITVTATDPVSGKTHALVLTVQVQGLSLTVSPLSAAVAPGAGVILNVTVNALNGFNQPVLIGCNNPPAGITCSTAFATPGQSVPITLMSASNVSGFKSVQIGAAPGLGAPVSLGLRSISLNVNSALATYLLTTSSAAQTAPVGSSAIYRLIVRSTKSTFFSTVSLSCLPTSNLACSFSPASFTPTTIARTVVLTVTPDPKLNPGSYPFTVQAVAANQVRQLAMTLNVADFWITATPGSQLIPDPNGGTASYTVTAQTSSNFNLPLTLSCPGAPAGVSCAFVPASVTPTQAGANSTLTVTTTAASPKGLLDLTVQAAAGSLAHQYPIQLTNGQDFALSFTPPSLTISPGGNDTANINVNAIGPFSAPVALACVAVNPQAALTCTFPGPGGSLGTPGNSTPLNISVLAGVPGGVYNITVQGMGGSLTHTANLTVNVPDYSLGLTQDLTVPDVVVGGAAVFHGALTAIAGYAGNVTVTCTAASPLSCANLPSSPLAPAPGGTPFMFSVTVPNGTPIGDYSVQLDSDDGAGHVHHAMATFTVKNYSVSFTSGAATVEAGTSTTFAGAVTGMNGYSGAVQLYCPPDLPDLNITCSFTPAVVNASASGSPFSATISTAPATSTGAHTVQLTRNGSHVIRQTPFALNVTPTNDFNVAIANQFPNSINAGDSLNVGLFVTAVNAFNATVSMTCSGAPAGMTCTPPPPFSVPPGGSFSVQVQTALGVIVPGTYNLTLTSSGGGKTHEQALTIAVRDFSISATPGAQQVLPGAEADYSVSMSSASGFAAGAHFTCSISGSPTGAACSFDQPDLAAGASTTLRVTSSAGTPPGLYTVDLTATSGSTVHSASVTVQVGGPDFTLTPGSLSVNMAAGVPAGQTAIRYITVTPIYGFSSPVTFSCGPYSPGATCSVTSFVIPAPAGSSVMVTLRLPKYASPGSHSYTLTATGGGQTHSIPITLNVN